MCIRLSTVHPIPVILLLSRHLFTKDCRKGTHKMCSVAWMGDQKHISLGRKFCIDDFLFTAFNIFQSGEANKALPYQSFGKDQLS